MLRHLFPLLKTRLPELLLGAVLLWFLFSPVENRHFHGELHLSFVSSHGMTIAEHLSPDDHWLMHNRKVLTDDHKVIYEPYNRFPITAYALIRAAAETGGDRIVDRIVAVRMLMRVLWVGAALLFFFSMVRLTANRSGAVAAVLFGFSTYYYLFYRELIFNDIPMVFGWALLLHGMILREQENRFTQLVVKSFIAVAIGWQSYALLLPYLFFSLLGNRQKNGHLKTPWYLSREALLGAGVILFGALLLGWNLWNEARAFHAPISQLPSVKSMLYRLGVGELPEHVNDKSYFVWTFFIPQQLWQIGTSLSPISLISFRNLWLPDGTFYRIFSENPMWAHHILRTARIAVGIGGIVAAKAAVRRLPLRPVTGALLLSGFIWSVPMRNFTALHPFQTLFYIGIPLLAWSFLFSLLHKRYPKTGLFLPLLAGIVFATSFLSIREKSRSDFWSGVTEEFQTISEALPQECRLFVDGDLRKMGGGYHAVSAYLPNCIFTQNRLFSNAVLTDIEPAPIDNLTPGNRSVFLTRPVPTPLPEETDE